MITVAIALFPIIKQVDALWEIKSNNTQNYREKKKKFPDSSPPPTQEIPTITHPF